MCGRGRSTYTIPGIQRLVGGRPIPRRLNGRGAAHVLRMRDTSSSSSSHAANVSISASSNPVATPHDPVEEEAVIEYHPVENLSPGMDVPVVFSSSSHLEDRYIDMMKWGLIPSYAKTSNAADHYKMFNARIETVSEKVSFKSLLSKKRCIVLFNGFYEWKGTPGHKVPYYVSLSGDQPMIMAALFDITSIGLETFTILTCDSCSSLKSLHDRQPVFLSPTLVDVWLDPEVDPAKALQLISQIKYSEFDIRVWEVDRRMTNPKYQGADCSNPVKRSIQQQLSFGKLSAPSSPNTTEKSLGQSSSPVVCPLCQEDITALSLSSREDHVHSCILNAQIDDDILDIHTGPVVYDETQASKKQKLAEI